MLDIHLPLMVFVFVVLMTLLFLLNRILFKPLIGFMDERNQSIAKDLESSKNLSGDSEELHTKAMQIINDAKTEAATIRQKAIDEAKLVAQGKIDAKQKELEAAYDSFAQNLAKEKNALKDALLAQMPQFKDGIKAKLSKF
ncbi:MAG: F0F1 ATP synthase subunit B' [Campylobacterales bacterium]|nr:F0F1 ATP synthase subunit B' [Campylobacterales bacterium]